MTFVIPGEIFPAEVKATCHGFSAACGKLGIPPSLDSSTCQSFAPINLCSLCFMQVVHLGRCCFRI
jgi:hypothetical protein